MNGITLKQLRYFEAVAAQKHFGRAAEVCAVSQPALSMQIKELETALGIKLFERSARQLRLTAFGEEFAENVRDVLRGADGLGELARGARERALGRLRLGIIPTVAPYLLPGFLARIRREKPGLELLLRETQTSVLLDELEGGRIDAAVLALPVSEPRLYELPLAEEPFVLVRPAEQGSEPVPSPESLREMQLLLLEEGHCFRDQALAFCEMPTARPREGFDASSLSTLVQLVGAGYGVTLLPQMAVPVETGRAAVSLARFPAPEPKRIIGMIWRKTTTIELELRQIAELVKDAVEDAIRA